MRRAVVALAAVFLRVAAVRCLPKRPAYLELREVAQTGGPADRYDVLWKVPVMGDARLAVRVRFPEGTRR